MNTVKDIQNKLKSSLGYNLSSVEIKKHLAVLGIQVKSLSCFVTDEEISRSLVYIRSAINASTSKQVGWVLLDYYGRPSGIRSPN